MEGVADISDKVIQLHPGEPYTPRQYTIWFESNLRNLDLMLAVVRETPRDGPYQGDRYFDACVSGMQRHIDTIEGEIIPHAHLPPEEVARYQRVVQDLERHLLDYQPDWSGFRRDDGKA